jgi:hypothetical protein
MYKQACCGLADPRQIASMVQSSVWEAPRSKACPPLDIYYFAKSYGGDVTAPIRDC